LTTRVASLSATNYRISQTKLQFSFDRSYRTVSNIFAVREIPGKVGKISNLQGQGD